MTPVRRIIQFPHPGGEHVPSGDEMNWNLGRHRRKFLVSHGRTVDRRGVAMYEGGLTFWGEWEPPSTVRHRWKRQDRLPTVLHEPYWVDRVAVSNQQNTDPWVFGTRFLYSNCKQLTPAGRPSSLQDLTPGSMILFGSTIGNRFVLDTVMVIAKTLTTYRPVDGIEIESDAFRACSIDSLASLEPKKSHARFTLFAGATPQKPYDGMFSFTPSRPADDVDFRFARPPVRLPGIINPSSRQSPRGVRVNVAPGDVREAWLSVVEQVEARRLNLGTHFEVPPRKKTQLPTKDSRS